MRLQVINSQANELTDSIVQNLTEFWHHSNVRQRQHLPIRHRNLSTKISYNNISLSPNIDSQLMQQCIKLITNFLVYYCTSVDIKNLGFKDNNNDPSFKDW